MSKCRSCNDDRYKLIACCSGQQCGCMGMPVQLSNCVECNPDDDKEMSRSLAIYEFIDDLEFIKLEKVG